MDGEEYRRAVLYKVTPNFLMDIIALISILFGIMCTSHEFSIGAIINLQRVVYHINYYIKSKLGDI